MRDEVLLLLPERGLYWKRTRTLIIADTHWGKAATFRAAAVPVPRGTTASGLERLDTMLQRTRARRLLILGDYLHAREGRAPATLRALADWRERHHQLEVELIRGNHDRRAGDPPPELGVRCLDAPLVEPPFVFVHHPMESAEGYVMAGHRHPAVRLIGGGRQRERLPCFYFRPGYAVLPAFGDFTGFANIEPNPADRIYVVAENAVMSIYGHP